MSLHAHIVSPEESKITEVQFSRQSNVVSSICIVSVAIGSCSSKLGIEFCQRALNRVPIFVYFGPNCLQMLYIVNKEWIKKSN